MCKFKDFYFSTDENVKIRVRSWIPEGEISATLQIAHGIAEHCERYDEFCEFLCDNGIAVYINDHRGHGKSIGDGVRGYFAKSGGWLKVVEDMRSIFTLSNKEYPDVPHFLFGHSMGSFLARTYLFTYPDDFAGAVICGTGHMAKAMITAGHTAACVAAKIAGDKPSTLLDKIAFGAYNAEFKPARTKFDWLTRDETVVDRYIADPLCGFVATAGLFKDMMSGLAMITNSTNIAKMKKSTPVFFIAGDKDPVGENGKAVMRAYDAFCNTGMTDVSVKLYKDARHEILNEINKHEVFDDILLWIKEKLF